MNRRTEARGQKSEVSLRRAARGGGGNHGEGGRRGQRRDLPDW